MSLQSQMDSLCYAATVIFPVWMVAWRAERRSRFGARCTACMVLMLAMAGFMTFWVELLVVSFPALRTEQLWLYIMKYSIVFLMAFFSVWICFDCDLWGALYCANTGYCLQHISARLVGIFTDIPRNGMPGGPLSNLTGVSAAVLVCALFWAAALCRTPKKQRLRVGSRWQIIIATCVAAVMIVYNTVGIRYAGELAQLAERSGLGLSAARGVMLFVYIMSMLVAFLTLLLALSIRSNEGLSSERDALYAILEKGKLQYQQERENIHLLDLKYHDLKHQLAALKGKIYEEQIDELTQAVNIYDTTVHTGNEALDVVLTQKALYCANHGITLTYLIDGGHYDFIPRHEMYALFNNILDNAIQAVESLPQEQRIISITEQSRGSFLAIRAENYCAAAPVFQNGLPVTDKAEPGHGYGMKSIRLIAEKYGGGLSVKAEGGMFVLDLYFQRE